MIHWLKQLLGIPDASEGNHSDASEAQQEIKPHQKRVFSTRDFSVGVAGTSHHRSAITFAATGVKSYKGRSYIHVVLQTEPENPHDANAVKVMTTTQETIGYLYRDDAKRYAPAIRYWERRGKWVGCQAVVVEKGRGDRVYLDLDKPGTIAG